MNKYAQFSRTEIAYGCERKKRYETERAARETIDPNGKVALRAYKCRFCDGWHRTASAKRGNSLNRDAIQKGTPANH